jgi:hypothetical protein
MPEMKIETPGVFVENKNNANEIMDPHDQDRARTEGASNKPRPGRMPARASRI